MNTFFCSGNGSVEYHHCDISIVVAVFGEVPTIMGPELLDSVDLAISHLYFKTWVAALFRFLNTVSCCESNLISDHCSTASCIALWPFECHLVLHWIDSDVGEIIVW